MKDLTQTVLFLGVVFTMCGRLSMADCTGDPVCSGHGTCDSDNKCDCESDYIGDTCQHDDPCLPDPCNGNGACAPDSSDPPEDVCSCDAGYGGDECELVSCDNNPCQNEGTCEVEDGSIECTCKPGWGGDRCENAPKCTDAIPCENGGTCKADTSGQDICFCAPGFDGDLCADASGAAKISVHVWMLAVVAVLTKLSLN